MCVVGRPKLVAQQCGDLNKKGEGILRRTQKLNISVPLAMAKMLRVKVESGEFANESEVIREALRILLMRDRVIEAWLQKQAASLYEGPQIAPVRAEKEDARTRFVEAIRFKAT